ncbi:hypothetical protein B0H16DRAFT_1734480 [Mycena metata]|uniref:Uncharacterized protein n=1 Tax=Mycena metata TaxID=1033252 RepID=A0AAD7HUJ9_9AGAR|nr:hypothetical protein B0H16DRAFT_1734480 [Mycena metata]
MRRKQEYAAGRRSLAAGCGLRLQLHQQISRCFLYSDPAAEYALWASDYAFSFGSATLSLTTLPLLRHHVELVLPVRLRGPLRRPRTNIVYGAVTYSLALALGFALVLDPGRRGKQRVYRAAAVFVVLEYAELGAMGAVGRRAVGVVATLYAPRNVFFVMYGVSAGCSFKCPGGSRWALLAYALK